MMRSAIFSSIRNLLFAHFVMTSLTGPALAENGKGCDASLQSRYSFPVHVGTPATSLPFAKPDHQYWALGTGEFGGTVYRAVPNTPHPVPRIFKEYQDNGTVKDAFMSPQEKATEDQAHLEALHQFIAPFSRQIKVAQTRGQDGPILELEPTQGQTIDWVARNADLRDRTEIILRYQQALDMISQRVLSPDFPEAQLLSFDTDSRASGLPNWAMSFAIRGPDNQRHFFYIHGGQVIVNPVSGSMTIVDPQ